ncbi:PqqD family peptide modification chaperone [Blastochloris sulfoviridis]|uniref:PqqD family protein n=1 Tax=Blastochloris sulfoviridis TaxID=50712 RepID=A0A5M6HUE2_9HYPH|nr:PqqD family peptide modification chaperone [Blastochloris sulfoviridis]KAA5599481.1 PqqD family protein [Blastochloris sulfoviridis]
MAVRQQIKPSLLITEKDDQLFALDTESGRVHEFNVTAKVILQLFLEPRDEEEAAAAFARAFDIPHAQALEDVRTMLAQFRANDLLLPDSEAACAATG